MKESTMEGLIAFRDEGIPPGDFLRAVLENNLMEAFSRADGENTRDMAEIMEFVYNDMPVDCHGSREKVNAWLDRKIQEREAMNKKLSK